MTVFVITWCSTLQFLFHLFEFSSLFLKRFLQICAAQLEERTYSSETES